ncbi:hypothetical protein Mal15_34700 [Stieleria maiorica]|uniref:Methyltransferase type 11 domain-containing protein n=1 Tax=Stieleria maiorica TaxID=2795974 RepID=A0A5B9MH03_9BACT|nr:class I SAM-dependent methyltransferase [Stieleria maiorica]QEF99406.1 hypothetical protein Mal15_34700 [Stieleria maiorica]
MMRRHLKQLVVLAGRISRRSRYEIAKRIMPSTAVLGPKVVPRVAGPLVEKRDIKLNLGCGPMHLDGYINIDAAPAACADFYMDFGELERAFSASSAREILMIHSLSYLNLWQAREFFRSAYRLLSPGGQLIIELPSIEKCAAHLLESRGNLPAYLEGVRGVFAFDLSEITNQVSFTPYSFGWSAWHLEHELRDASFSRIVVTEPEFHQQPWRDIRVEASK